VGAVPFPYVERPIQHARLPSSQRVWAHLMISYGVLMITAAADPGWPDDVEIADHEGAGLPILRSSEPPGSPPSKFAPRASSEACNGKFLLTSPPC
jgi:hypothetical protein